MVKPLLSSQVHAVRLTSAGAVLLDQTALPETVAYVTLTHPEEMIHAIQTMVVRGAPAIGIAGAFGVILAARQLAPACANNLQGFVEQLQANMVQLASARPTAVNLAWAIEQLCDCLLACAAQQRSPEDITACLTEKAETLLRQDIEMNQAIGQHGKALVPKGGRILTHCNAGALATGGYGTALGIVRAAFADDPTVTVYADETRPRLQGAKLTTWELVQDGIPVTLVSDGMCASLMSAGKIDCVIVGADRIAANGDTANKIGTHTLAVVAAAYDVPFYVAAPSSTFDVSLAHGNEIPIEFRPDDEITELAGTRLCAQGVSVYNPSFDVTPARLITAIISERGIARPDYCKSLTAC